MNVPPWTRCRLPPVRQSEGLLRPLLELEMPLVRVLAAMEAAGVALAPQVLRDQRGPLEARLRQLAHKAHLAAGMTFDLNSPKVGPDARGGK